MDSEAVFDKIIQNLEFEVEAVHEENTERFLGVENATPLNVKIRVRKKNETGVLHPGFISVPKFVQSNKIPNKIRLVNSDQTIVSFNLLMESDNGQNTITPSKRKHFFGVFKSGGCMDPQNDYDDDYSYKPSSSARTPKTNSIVINTSNYKLKIKSNGKNVNAGNSSYEPKKTKRQKRLFGYCKPGGCLDPPFNEDQYSYKPSYLEQTTFPVKKKSSLVRESERNKNTDLIDEDELIKLKKKSKYSSWKEQDKVDSKPSKDSSWKEQEKVDSKPIISIFHTDSTKISLDTAYSNSIITYPPTLSSSELYLSEKRSGNNAKNTNLSVMKVSKPSNDYHDKFFLPPKNSIGKKTRDTVEVLRSTGLETVLPQISKEKGNNANNDTVINKEERNKKQNQYLNLLRSGTIQSDFDNLGLLTREAHCTSRRVNENSENDRIKLKNNSYELKNIPTKISSKLSFTHKVTSRSGQNISIGDLGFISDTKSSKDVSKNKIYIHNEMKCNKLDKSLHIEKQSNNSVTNSDIIGKVFTNSFTKTNIIEKKDNMENKETIDPLTCIKNEEIRELNHSSCFDSTAFKNEQGLDIISINSTKRYFLSSNCNINNDMNNQDIKSSNDITVNEKHSYSDKKSNRVEEKPMVNSDSINAQIHHHNKVIGNESKIMSDFILSVSKNKSDHSNFKVIISDSSKANPTSSDDLEKSKDLGKSNSYIEKESAIKERKFHNSADSHNYLTKGKRQFTNSSSANSENLLDSVTINVSPSMEPLSTQVINKTENKNEYIEGESKCKVRKSHTSTDSNDYLTESKSQPTSSCCKDSPNSLDSVTLNDNLTMEPLPTSLTHNISTKNTIVYVEKEPKLKEEMSHNSTDNHNYSTKSDRQLINSSLRNSDSVTLNDNPSMEFLSLPLSNNISTENRNVYIEKEPKIKEEISHNSNESHNCLNKSDRQLTSSSCSNSLNLLDSVILNERPLTEPLSIPLPHNILTENTSNDLLKKSQHLLTKNKSDDLFEQSKINVIKHQNYKISNSSSNLDNHSVNADITKINDNIDLETKHYDKTNNQNKSSNNNRLENEKLVYVSRENESEVFKSNSSIKVHENDFEKPSENWLPVKDLKKLLLHENIGTAMKLLEINENNQIFEKKYDIDHLYLEKNKEDSISSTDSSMPNFIEESPNLKQNNKNSQVKLLLNIKEKSEHNENKILQAMDANPNESLSKSINSDSQSSEKLLPPKSPSYIFDVEQVKNNSEEVLEKLQDDSKGENTQIESLITKSNNIKYNAKQGQAFGTILSGNKFNNISKTQINLISESLQHSFHSSGKSISSNSKIKKDIDRNEILANSCIKTTTKYDLDSIDSTTKQNTQFSHSFQSEKSQNSVFYDNASRTVKETDINNILNKDSIYVNNTLVRDTASIRHAVIKHSEFFSEKHITDDKQCSMDSEPLWPNKNSIRHESLIELYEQNAVSHHNLLNIISKERIKNSVFDPKFASKSRGKSQITFDLGFQSYYNYAKHRRVLKSLDTSIVNVRYPNDAVTVIKSDNLHDNEIKISVDSEMDMSIQILQKHKITLDEHQKAIQDVKTIRKKNSINEDKNYTKDNCVVSEDVAQSYEIALEKTLNSVYEQQLIPLQDMIKSLKSEIDNLADQHSEVRETVFKSHLYPTNRTRSVRLIRTNKRCRCLKK